ncbi:uncharacterized protein LOC135812259 [Sycon ciliatum]|uniref:uncharacterized protein LOC135812259 n=1 Tax=Sycon ciliatum TaxID=27933 RepID=UPI0031F65AE2
MGSEQWRSHDAVVVADVGGWNTRIGVVTDEDDDCSLTPTSTFRTAIGKRSQQRQRDTGENIKFPRRFLTAKERKEWHKPMSPESFYASDGLESGESWQFGDSALELFREETGTKACLPIQNGPVENWDAMENIYHYAYFNCLRLSPAEHPLACSLNASLSIAQKGIFLEEMLEKLCVPAVLPFSDAALALYATGLSTGVVLMAGHTTTHAVAFHQGVPVTEYGNITSLPVGGRHITKIIATAMQNRQYRLHNYAPDAVTDEAIAHAIKESQCYVSENPRTDLMIHRNILGGIHPDVPAEHRDYFKQFRPSVLKTDSFHSVVPESGERLYEHQYRAHINHSVPTTSSGGGLKPKRNTGGDTTKSRGTNAKTSAAGNTKPKTAASAADKLLEFEDPMAPLIWASRVTDRRMPRALPPEHILESKFARMFSEEGLPTTWEPGPPCTLPDTPDDHLTDEQRKFLTGRRKHGRSGNLYLADRTRGQLGSEQFMAPELLFRPQYYPSFAVGHEPKGLAELAQHSVNICDDETMVMAMKRRVITAGGCSLLPGFSQRLNSSLDFAWGTGVHRLVTTNNGTCDEVWRGAATVACIYTFQRLFVTARDLHEYGPNILHVKGLF